VAAAQIAAGHARLYGGGARGGWCEIGARDGGPALASIGEE
jgi:hypothetical protein